MAERFVLECPDGLRWAVDPPFDPFGDGYVRRARVEIRADGLTATTTATMEGTGARDIAGFFADLAAGWRGWTGVQRWRAMEDEMAIMARHDGRANVMIAVTIRGPRRYHADDAWSARIVLPVEAGEQLSAIARDLASLLGNDQGPG